MDFSFLHYLFYNLPYVFFLFGMAQYIEGTMAAPDAAFDYGRPNISIQGAVVTALATGVSFGMTRPGSFILTDALTWQIQFAGTISGAPTILLEGSNDGTNWFTIDTYNATTSTLRSVSSHSGTGLPTHVLAFRARISVVGTGSGTVTVILAA